MQERLELSIDRIREIVLEKKLQKALSIMKQAATKPLTNPGKSIGGLIGGEAKKVAEHGKTSNCVCGSMLSKAISYSMAVLEVNASMGLIVAAPTAGSSGIVPGLLLSLQEEHRLSDGSIMDALFNSKFGRELKDYIAINNSRITFVATAVEAPLAS